MGWTPIPNQLIDGLMPGLKDTEWRLLLVVLRETLGRSNENGKRKRRNWLSQSQLKRRTGRESAALSKAIESLCSRGIIDIYDVSGRPLHSARIRRRYRGYLRFGLNLDFLAQFAKSEFHKANYTKERPTKENIKEGIRKANTNSKKAYWNRVGKLLKDRGSLHLKQRTLT